jgi:hypothetical protein
MSNKSDNKISYSPQRRYYERNRDDIIVKNKERNRTNEYRKKRVLYNKRYYERNKDKWLNGYNKNRSKKAVMV